MRVAVIMSTYNGEEYLQEQINSILEQKNVDIDLFIRDDGSTDGTMEIMKKCAASSQNINYNAGQNIGFRQSFMQELKKAKNYEYYAFSDQDDFWEKEKVEAACKKINQLPMNLPVVYYSNLNVSDEKLNIYRTTELENRTASLESLIMRRSIAGCTMVFNAKMWECIMKVNINDDMLRRGHDSFILSLCYALGGEVLCDKNAFIRYRQHMTNASGSSHGFKQRVKKEINNMLKKKGTEPAIARSILNNWNDQITTEGRNTLELVVKSEYSFGARIAIFFSPKFTTGNFLLTTCGKIKALFGSL